MFFLISLNRVLIAMTTSKKNRLHPAIKKVNFAAILNK